MSVPEEIGTMNTNLAPNAKLLWSCFILQDAQLLLNSLITWRPFEYTATQQLSRGAFGKPFTKYSASRFCVQAGPGQGRQVSSDLHVPEPKGGSSWVPRPSLAAGIKKRGCNLAMQHKTDD